MALSQPQPLHQRQPNQLQLRHLLKRNRHLLSFASDSSGKWQLTMDAPIVSDASMSAPTITGGTTYPSQGLELSLGNDVQHIPLLGGEQVVVTGREVAGKVALDLTAAQVVTFMTAVKANTTQSMGLMHGTTAGYKVMLFAPAAQLINPKKVDVNGKLMCGYDVRLTPSAGNDDLKIVVH